MQWRIPVVYGFREFVEAGVIVRRGSRGPVPSRRYLYRQAPEGADPADLPVQGNLDPLALIAGGEALASAVSRILSTFEERPHIFNLGHGILPDTPIAHVEHLLRLVRRSSGAEA